MNRIAGALLVTFMGVMATGCIETQMLVTVNSDGSGSIEERMLMNNMIADMLQGMAEGMNMEGEETTSDAPADASSGPSELFSKEELLARAEKMGGGVTLVSYEEAESETGKGYNAYYTFEDINSLRVNQNPGAAMPSMPGEEADATEDEEYVLFQLTPGSPARLIITPPSDESEGSMDMPDEGMPNEDETESDSPDGDMEFEQMKQFFRGMRMRVAVKVNGTIQETNASYVDGSTLTLIDFEFDKLLEQPELLKELEQAENMSPAAAQEMLKNIPGMKFDIADDIFVTFN